MRWSGSPLRQPLGQCLPSETSRSKQGRSPLLFFGFVLIHDAKWNPISMNMAFASHSFPPRKWSDCYKA
jgi:hypothetical protein